MPFPRRITSASLAKFVGWRTERVSDALRAMGIARKDQPGQGHPIYCRPEDLAAAWPDLYEVLLERLDEVKEAPERRGGWNRGKGRKNKPSKREVRKDCTVQCEHVWVVSLPATDLHCEKCGELA